jgi:hypothetical protein
VVFLFARKGPLWFSSLKQWATSEPSSHRFARFVQRFLYFLLFGGRADAGLGG